MPDNTNFDGSDLDTAGKPLQATPAAFSAMYGTAAQSVADQTGIDANTILGQWGLETGWGKSIIPGTNNLGNIKDFSGKGTVATDNQNGSVDKYQQFDSVDDFANHYASLLKRKYPNAIDTGVDANATAKGLAGYAEDPKYAGKIVNATSMVAKARGIAPSDVSGDNSMSPISSANAATNNGASGGNFDGSDLDAALSNPNLPKDFAPPVNALDVIKSGAMGAFNGAGKPILQAQALLGRGLTTLGATNVGSGLTTDAQGRLKEINADNAALPNQTAANVGDFIGQGIGTLPLAAVTGPVAGLAARGGAILAPAIDYGLQGAVIGAGNAAGNGEQDLGTPALIGGLAGGALGAATGSLTKYISGLKGGAPDFDSVMAPSAQVADSTVTGLPTKGIAQGVADAFANPNVENVSLGNILKDKASGVAQGIADSQLTPAQRAEQLIRNGLGTNADVDIQKSFTSLNNPSSDLPAFTGGQAIPLTPAQAINSTGAHQLEQVLSNKSEGIANQIGNIRNSQQNALQSTLAAAAPEGTISKLEGVRAGNAKPLYDANSTSSVPFSALDSAVMARPSIQTALKNANRVLQDQGVTVPSIATPQEAADAVKAAGGTAAAQLKAAQAAGMSPAPASITGSQIQAMLQDLKSTAANINGTAAERKGAQSAAQALVEQADIHFPYLKAANQQFAKDSIPVNDANFLSALKNSRQAVDATGNENTVTAGQLNNAINAAKAAAIKDSNGIFKSDTPLNEFVSPEVYSRIQSLQQQANLTKTPNVLKGANSTTAKQLSAMFQNSAAVSPGSIGSAATLAAIGHPVAAIGALSKNLFNAASIAKDKAAGAIIERAMAEATQSGNPGAFYALVVNESIASAAGKKVLREVGENAVKDSTIANALGEQIKSASPNVQKAAVSSLSAKALNALGFITRQAPAVARNGLLQAISQPDRQK